jgi:hypothetical protein
MARDQPIPTGQARACPAAEALSGKAEDHLGHSTGLTARSGVSVARSAPLAPASIGRVELSLASRSSPLAHRGTRCSGSGRKGPTEVRGGNHVARSSMACLRPGWPGLGRTRPVLRQSSGPARYFDSISSIRSDSSSPDPSMTIRPRRSTYARSATFNACRTCCSTSRTATPSLRAASLAV